MSWFPSSENAPYANGNSSNMLTMYDQNQQATAGLHQQQGMAFNNHNGYKSQRANVVHNTIRSATQEQLFSTQNSAYMQLYHENNCLQAELNAQKELFAIVMREKLIAMAAVTAHTVNPPSKSKISHTGLQPSDLQLIVPPSPPQLNQDDYPNVDNWTKAQWNDIKNKYHKTSSTSMPKLTFIVNNDGGQVSATDIKAMTDKAKALFTLYYQHNVDPPTWKAKSDTVRRHFSNTMRSEFPEFQLCKHDWKIEQFAIARYPDWVSNIRNGGRLKRLVPSFSSTTSKDSKRKMSASSNTKPIVKVKKEFQPAKMPNDIIEIASSDSESNQPPPKKKFKPMPVYKKVNVVQSTPTMPTPSADIPSMDKKPTIPNPSPNAPSGSEVPRVSSPATAIAAHPPASEEMVTTSSAASPTTKDVCRPPSAAPQTVSTSTPATDSGIPITNRHTTKSTPSAQSAESPLSVAKGRLGSQEDTPIEKPAAPVDTNAMGILSLVPPEPLNTPSTTRKTRRLTTNLFLDLDIPRPANGDITPIATATSTDSGPSAAPAATASKKKGDKLMELTDSLTARNLYAQEYLKTNPGTTVSQFKAVFDALDHQTIKQFEVLSRQKKQEQKKGAIN